MNRSLVVAFLLVAACGKHHNAPKPTPTEAECQAYRDKLFSFMPEDERAKGLKLGLGKQTPKELEPCQQRMPSDEIACVVASRTVDEALACKPAVDDRAPEIKRTPEECAALSEHVKKLAATNDFGDSIGPPFTPFMASLFARECGRWMTQDRYDCVMKA